MARKVQLFKTRGMNRDLSVSAFNPEFSFENKNLRLSTNEGNTMMSWVNERGTSPVTLYRNNAPTTIIGMVIGTAVINHKLVLFLSGEQDKAGGYKDTILKLTYRDDKASMDVETLYVGKLGLSSSHPLETLVSYESEKVQKVYWTDGANQPRVINVSTSYGTQEDGETYNPFDFVPELALGETVTVRKILGGNGLFPPGVIQYAFTYYNKHMQESCIFYTTPLCYISHQDRGASPEDRVDNAFQITVDNVDSHFDYLRIYSIQRTSLDDTPIAKRIQDIPLKGLTKVSYTDTGTSGETIDPTELLYKGGEILSAETLEQKDGTLFLGNLRATRKYIERTGEDSLASRIQDKVRIAPSYTGRGVYLTPPNAADSYLYANQLTGYSDPDLTASTPCAGFKVGDTYRFGVQFQHKSGKWTGPIFIDDVPYDKCTITTASGEEEVDAPRPYISTTNGHYEVVLPQFEGLLPKEIATTLIRNGYRKVRPLVVFPRPQDRATVCQGIACPTLYTDTHRKKDKNIAAQSSWFFRTPSSSTIMTDEGAVEPVGKGYLPYAKNTNSYDPKNIRQVEIQGSYEAGNQFQTDSSFLTLHSPDIEFDTNLSVTEFTGTGYRQVAQAPVVSTFSDIDIQTETPTISSDGNGFVHKSFVADGMHGIVSGLFYDDYLAEDTGDYSIRKYISEHSAAKWMVYLWNKDGSLNNDINRPTDKGTATAKLKMKAVSNLRFCGPPVRNGNYASAVLSPSTSNSTPQLFSSEEATFLKVDGQIYMGNVDTMLIPDDSDGQYFSLKGSKKLSDYDANPPFTGDIWMKTFADPSDSDSEKGLWAWSGSAWSRVDSNFGKQYEDLVLKKTSVRMKYKSTPHLVFKEDNSHKFLWQSGSFPVVEITRSLDKDTLFGGKTDDALMENKWVPCGEPVSLSKVRAGDNNVVFYCTYGDTYFQRWDCLKTYAFTTEDVNQVVEIGSFMLETHVNIDGRYDRNRGQVSNTNMSPRNFNLLNPVYSQVDNFFTYRILDNDSYANTSYPNQLTWSLTKTSGADVDLWTHITMASTLELDGDKGQLNGLVRLNDQLLAFQDTGISQILYNENVQISSNDGTPIEIANSGKVQGKRYVSDTIGCSNRHSITVTPSGIYFMDSDDKGIYVFNGQLQSLSTLHGLNSWARQNIPDGKALWTPMEFGNFASYYDKQNQDVLFIDKSSALAFSERFNAFTSFYDYGGTPYFTNLDDTGLWARIEGSLDDEGNTVMATALYSHNTGQYSVFFGTPKPYWMTLVANPEPQTSKIFTNLELRASVDGDGTGDANGHFAPLLPFDSLEAWDDYQHGITELGHKTGYAAIRHFAKNGQNYTSSLKRKFRIWDCDIPRNNQGTGSFKPRPVDRMRNPWLYVKLQKNVQSGATSLDRVEIDDILLTYFN